MSYISTPAIPQNPPMTTYPAYPGTNPSNTPSVLQPSASQPPPRKRSVSPAKDKPVRAAPTFDFRAEEEAARRMNAGRVGYGNIAGGRGKKSDLIGTGRGSIRSKLDLMVQEQNLKLSEEALTYLTLAAETRIRTLLTSSLSAQSHRTNTNHLHPPSIHPKSGKPLYTHRITSDTNSVLEALARQNKEAEQSFRVERIDRLAREAEGVKAKERRELAIANGDDVDFVDGMGGGGPATPARGLNGNGEKSEGGGGGGGGGVGGGGGGGGSGSGSAGPSTPTFGVVPEKKGPKKSAMKKAKDMSADVALKMSNLTANRSAGVGKKYSWLTSAPHQSSPLAPKKRKAEEVKQDGAAAGAGGKGGAEYGGGDVAMDGKGKGKARDEGESGAGAGIVGSDRGEVTNGDVRPAKRTRSVLNFTPPSRRSVLVSRNSMTGEERRVPDDRALTVVDILFALERDGAGKGMETGDEILRRARALGEGGDAARR